MYDLELCSITTKHCLRMSLEPCLRIRTKYSLLDAKALKHLALRPAKDITNADHAPSHSPYSKQRSDEFDYQ